MTTKEVLGVPLKEWVDANEPGEQMGWYSRFWEQVRFVGDRIPRLLAVDNKDDVELIRDNVRVISTHRSKSIVLPVYSVTAPNGTVFTMRNNFYNWKISVESRVDVWAPFEDLFNSSERIPDMYCEGFPEDKVFGSYDNNQKRFTVELPDSQYAMFTFFWVYSRLRQGRH